MSALQPHRMPVLFVGHGSPMNALADNACHRTWASLGQRLPRPKAILCISAHWLTRGVCLTGAVKPETIHDFQGFPAALYAMQYPAPGDPALARHIMAQLATREVSLDSRRGLDHGAWGVLAAMYPAADVPVVQLSLDLRQPGAVHYAIAGELACLRDEGVLIVGSGNVVHNLGLFRGDASQPLDWAVRCDAEIKRRIAARDHQALIDYRTLDPQIDLAVPTPEHYFPLLYALALHREGEPLRFFNEAVLGSISMTSVLIGEAN
ncbi:MAG: 4,5-DOPA dioxygenase extradiol [Rhodocyclaceae bacterium]|nr:4,5-DOPA dioxygenase extradiol [Rhodocyclaceae bacterium]